MYLDTVYEISKSRALGDLLRTSTDLHDAIIVAEPESIAEAISYYADNDIYLLREQKFGKVSSWSSHTSNLDLTLHDILVIARDLKNSTGRPILILLEYPVTVPEAQQFPNLQAHPQTCGGSAMTATRHGRSWPLHGSCH